MKGKVVVITGALGKVVAEEALSRGARVAGIDHAASQFAATAERIELAGVDLTDAAQGGARRSRGAARRSRPCAPWRTSYMRDDDVWPPSMQARSEAACPRTSRNFATRLACRALIGSSLRLRARLIVSAGLRTSPRAT
jgi:NAD(P)-dependent dehydrogenase (short-subunit alcohol dehydrogenase family)